MAIFYLKTIPVSRKKGQSATAGIAYRAGEKIIDERTGLIHDYTKKRGVLHTELFNNHGLTRAELWNMAELKETRSNSRVAREFQVALPHDLHKEQHLSILKKYADMLAKKYGVAVDVAIHSPSKAGDHRNIHAHIYCTTRVLKSNQTLGEKSLLEQSDTQLKKAGQMSGARQIRYCRAQWARLINHEYRNASKSTRISHLSLKDQDIDRIPQIHVGPLDTQLVRMGYSDQAERWQINEAIKATNNILSLQDARNKKMQNQRDTKARNNSTVLPKKNAQFGGLADSQKSVVEAETQIKMLLEQKQKQELKNIDNEPWKPVNIDPRKGAVINMFRQDSQGIYRWTKGRNEGTEAFRDTGKTIHSQTTNSWAIAAELELAKSKVDSGDWKEVRAFGSEEYRRAAWIQGQNMGIEVKGYEPSKAEIIKYASKSNQGLVGDKNLVPQNKFIQSSKFQNKFDEKSSGVDMTEITDSTKSQSPKN